MQPYRSMLFVPAHKPDWGLNALASGADSIVVDLEDSVAHEHKAAARRTALETVRELRARSTDVGLFVRVNAWDTGLGGLDLEAVACDELTGIFIPKVESALDVVRWDAVAEHVERKARLAAMSFVLPVETVGAIQNCREIAGASPRTGAMVVSTSEHADIARAVGYRQTVEGRETLYFRSRVLLACREYGLHPITGLWEDVDDLAGLADFARRGEQLGFRGQIAIHPSHVPVIHGAFTPSQDEVDFYQGLVDAVEAAAADGRGAVRYRGKHVDIAHAEKAREWLIRARQLTEDDRT